MRQHSGWPTANRRINHRRSQIPPCLWTVKFATVDRSLGVFLHDESTIRGRSGASFRVRRAPPLVALIANQADRGCADVCHHKHLRVTRSNELNQRHGICHRRLGSLNASRTGYDWPCLKDVEWRTSVTATETSQLCTSVSVYRVAPLPMRTDRTSAVTRWLV